MSIGYICIPVLPNLTNFDGNQRKYTLSPLQYKRLSDWINFQPIKEQDKKELLCCAKFVSSWGRGVSASIFFRGKNWVIKGGGGVLRGKNLQILDLQKLASLSVL